jgi:hypothetical protein
MRQCDPMMARWIARLGEQRRALARNFSPGHFTATVGCAAFDLLVVQQCLEDEGLHLGSEDGLDLSVANCYARHRKSQEMGPPAGRIYSHDRSRPWLRALPVNVYSPAESASFNHWLAETWLANCLPLYVERKWSTTRFGDAGWRACSAANQLLRGRPLVPAGRQRRLAFGDLEKYRRG